MRVFDLRPIGLDALLHLACRRGSRGQHKLELLDTGKKPYSELVRQIDAVCYGDHDRLGLSSGIGPLKWQTISRAGIETIRAGRRPNVIRVYDKVTESKAQFRKIKRKLSKDADELDFEKEFGFAEDAVVTRVERQCGGGRIPPEIERFGQLSRAADLNPFSALEITGNDRSTLPDVTECDSLNEWLSGMQVNRMIQEMGMQSFRRWLNRHSNGNGVRLLKRLHAFLPGAERVCCDGGDSS